MSQDLPRRLLVATGVQDPPDGTTQVVEALRAAARALRHLLHPVLPAGIRTVEEYLDTSNPYASPLPYLL